MKILLHICCAPCAVFPVKVLRKQEMDVHGFYYRHNIHPYTECLKRQETLQAYEKTIDLHVIYQQDYDLEGFVRNVVFRESKRCEFCYQDRLKATAMVAKRGKFDFFSTTLLYSRYQQHEAVKSIGEEIGRRHDVPFYYSDFRTGWKEGIAESRQLGMYRQQYCGCIYSEKERYF